MRFIENSPNQFWYIFLSSSHIYISNINICFMNFFPLYQILLKFVEAAESNQDYFWCICMLTKVEEILVFLFNLYSLPYDSVIFSWYRFRRNHRSGWNCNYIDEQIPQRGMRALSQEFHIELPSHRLSSSITYAWNRLYSQQSYTVRK